MRAIFTWAIQNGLLPKSEFPSKGLRYPKIIETFPFQTLEAVQQQTAGLDPAESRFQDLWGTDFLSLEQIEEFLDHVQQSNIYPFVYVSSHLLQLFLYRASRLFARLLLQTAESSSLTLRSR